jgi:hypothetical protein
MVAVVRHPLLAVPACHQPHRCAPYGAALFRSNIPDWLLITFESHPGAVASTHQAALWRLSIWSGKLKAEAQA